MFARLFLEGRPDEVQAQARRLRDGQSVLDSVRDQAKKLQPALGVADREKLDEYFTSVRELEQRLVQAEEWSRRPKPKVDAKPPQNITNGIDLVGKTRIWFDLVHLALQTDSSRLITLDLLGTSGVPPIPGVTFGHHDLSHHGKDPAKIEQLKKVETGKDEDVAHVFDAIEGYEEDSAQLARSHHDLFQQQFGRRLDARRKEYAGPVCRRRLQAWPALGLRSKGPAAVVQFVCLHAPAPGIEADKFGSSKGTLTGLEMTG